MCVKRTKSVIYTVTEYYFAVKVDRVEGSLHYLYWLFPCLIPNRQLVRRRYEPGPRHRLAHNTRESQWVATDEISAERNWYAPARVTADCAAGVRAVPVGARRAPAARVRISRRRTSAGFATLGLRASQRGRCVQRCSGGGGSAACRPRHWPRARGLISYHGNAPRAPRSPRYAILAARGRPSTVALQPCVATLPPPNLAPVDIRE